MLLKSLERFVSWPLEPPKISYTNPYISAENPLPSYHLSQSPPVLR